MKSFIYIIFALFLFVSCPSAQTAAKPTPTPQNVLRVEVENGKNLSLTAKDLAKFTRREVKGTAHDEKESLYSGYNLSDILLDAGAKIGKGELKSKELAAYLVVEAADGYKAIFAIAEIAPEFTDKVVLLADTRDGKPLTEKEGFWQLIVPDDKKHGRWVRQVITLKIKKNQ
jgi:Oxidoreductase molybdopterin binding domain